MAASSLLQASVPCVPTFQEGVEPAVPLACRLQHAAGGTVEQTTTDSTLAQAGVQDGLWAQSAAPTAHPHCFWECESQEDAATQGCWRGWGNNQVFRLQRAGQGVWKIELFPPILWNVQSCDLPRQSVPQDRAVPSPTSGGGLSGLSPPCAVGESCPTQTRLLWRPGGDNSVCVAEPLDRWTTVMSFQNSASTVVPPSLSPTLA